MMYIVVTELVGTSTVACSAELVLLSKQQISGGGAYSDCY